METAVADPIEQSSPPTNNLVANPDFSQPARGEHELAAYWAVANNPNYASAIEVVKVEDGSNAVRFTIRREVLEPRSASGPFLSPATQITSTGDIGAPKPGDSFHVNLDAKVDPFAALSDTSINTFIELLVEYEDGTTNRLIAKDALNRPGWISISSLLQVDSVARAIKAMYVNIGCRWENNSTSTTGVPEISVLVKNVSVVRVLDSRTPNALVDPAGNAIEQAAEDTWKTASATVVAALPGVEAIVESKLREFVPQVAAHLREELSSMTLASVEDRLTRAMASAKAQGAPRGWLVPLLLFCCIVALGCGLLWNYRFGHALDAAMVLQQQQTKEQIDQYESSVNNSINQKEQQRDVAQQKELDDEHRFRREITLQLITNQKSLQAIAAAAQRERSADEQRDRVIRSLKQSVDDQKPAH